MSAGFWPVSAGEGSADSVTNSAHLGGSVVRNICFSTSAERAAVGGEFFVAACREASRGDAFGLTERVKVIRRSRCKYIPLDTLSERVMLILSV